MKPQSFVIGANQRSFLIGVLLVSILLAACGTFQVEVATSPEPALSAGGIITPTPNFDEPAYSTASGVTFDNRIILIGYGVEPESTGVGSSVMVTLVWQVLDEIPVNYNTFVHMVNEAGQLLAQTDAPPGGGLRPSTGWILNEYIYDQHQLKLPSGMTIDDVEIRAGIYDTEEGLRLGVDSPNFVTVSSILTPTPDESPPAVAVPAPTDTPQVGETDTGLHQDTVELRVAYVKDSNIWLWDPEAGPAQMTVDGGVDQVWLSDDGQRIAFRRDQNIWVVDGDGGNERQLTNAADFEGLSAGLELDPYVTGIIPYQVAWRPNSHQLFLNTSPQIEGPGFILSDDLWVGDVDSLELMMLLEPGEGGNFSISPDGQQVAIITPGRIDLMMVDGSGRREAFTHTPVITFSEFEYYAQPIWAPDSGSLRVAIPPADRSISAAQPTSIWNIPVADRPAWLLGQVTVLPGLHPPALFAPNLARLAYLTGEFPDSDPNSHLPGMAISEASESTIWDPVIFPAEVESVHGWSPDGIRLLYASPTAGVAEIVMGQPEIRTLINGDSLVLNVTWTDNFRFMYLQQNLDGWEILLGFLDGSEPEFIDFVTGNPVSYDFAWVSAKPAGNQ